MGEAAQLSVVVLDDDQEMGAYLELALSRSGFKVTVVREPEEIPQQPKYDAALVDICLKGGADGLGVAIDLLDGGIPTAIMTGLPSASPSVKAARAAGIGIILQKPFSLASLKKAVTQLISAGCGGV